MWDAATGEELLVLRGHEGQVLSCSYNPGGDRIVSGSDDGSVRVWDGVTGEELRFHLVTRFGSAAWEPPTNRVLWLRGDDWSRLSGCGRLE